MKDSKGSQVNSERPKENKHRMFVVNYQIFLNQRLAKFFL